MAHDIRSLPVRAPRGEGWAAFELQVLIDGEWKTIQAGLARDVRRSVRARVPHGATEYRVMWVADGGHSVEYSASVAL